MNKTRSAPAFGPVARPLLAFFALAVLALAVLVPALPAFAQEAHAPAAESHAAPTGRGEAHAADEGHGAEGDHGEPSLFAGDIGNAVWTLVIFVLVVLVLGKFAWGPILSGLQAREAYIHDSLAKAKADREAAEARLAEYEQRLDAARAEATSIVEEGRRDAEVVKARLEAAGREEAEKMTARAKREIEIATQTALHEIYEKTGLLATSVASKIIEKQLDPTDHERLVADAISRIEATESGSAGAAS